MSTVQLFRRERAELRALRRDRPQAPRRQHRVDLLLRGVLPGDRGGQRAGGGADHLVRRRQRAWRGTLTLGALVAFLQYSQRFFRPISDMSEKFNILQAAMASSERIFKLLDEPVAIASPQRPAVAEARAGTSAERGAVTSSFDHVWFAYNERATGCCGTCRSRSSRASASASSARPARERRRSSTCCCASTTCSAAGSPSTASTSASSTSPTCAACSASCCRTCTCSPARSPTTSGSGNASIDDERVRRAARGGARGRVHRAAAGRLRSAGRRARRDAVGRAEAAAVVRARAGVRSARADPRRSDVERRHRDRAADPRRAATC